MSFENYRGEYEREAVRRQVLDAQINIVELFYNRIISQSEAEVLTAALAKVGSQQDLEAVKKEMDEKGILALQRLDHEKENEAAIQILRAAFQEKIGMMDAENWKSALTHFIGQASLNHPDVFQENLVKGWLSRLLEQAYHLSRQSGMAAGDFGEKVANAMREAGRMPDFLAANTRVVAGKRQPAFLESIEATIERLALAERLPEVFGKSVQGIIVGGSLSYGPFYNVRKNIDITGGSDIDVICIIAERDGVPAQVALVDGSDFALTDSDFFAERARHFNELRREGKADVLSQRFQVASKDFTMSVHFFPAEFFSEMNNEQISADLARNEDVVFAVRDYKAKPFEHGTCIQQSFDGENYPYIVPNQKETERGIIARLPGYIIQGGRFYPGLYQNLISPEFAVFDDATGYTSAMVGRFQRLMLERMRQEKEIRPSSSTTKSHIRNRVFAPERYLD
jgi:hypothetical protein